MPEIRIELTDREVNMLSGSNPPGSRSDLAAAIWSRILEQFYETGPASAGPELKVGSQWADEHGRQWTLTVVHSFEIDGSPAVEVRRDGGSTIGMTIDSIREGFASGRFV